MSVSTRKLTTINTVVRPSEGSEVVSYTTKAVMSLENKKQFEKDELQHLNQQLKDYLDDVRKLEDLNVYLLNEVEKAKEESLPKIVDKSRLDQELETQRYRLEQEANSNVQVELKIVQRERVCQHVAQRIKFFQQEGETQKQKIFTLESKLNELESQRKYLANGVQLALEDLEQEQAKQDQVDRDLDSIALNLNETKAKNKNLEFEIQTLMDEFEFRKAIFIEESNYLKSRFNGTILNGSELAAFYKNELAIAIRQIRQDFVTLSEQQLREYKEIKEQELEYAMFTYEQERLRDLQAKARQDQSKELELQTAQQLRDLLDIEKFELANLQSRNGELTKRLASYESTYEELKRANADKIEKLESEIEALKEHNSNLANEIEYWQRVTRTKLESEITTYRSLLNTQIKYIKSSAAPLTEKSKSKSGKVVVTTIVTEQVVDENGNVIDTIETRSSENGGDK